ncbi:MAG TPA: hypothetical protein VI643_06985 [Planctomycetota bacterium]|nr:hypothetical protein [Planctomycetota bacterium]
MTEDTNLALGLAAAGLPLIAVHDAGSGPAPTLNRLVPGLLGCGNPLFRLSLVPLLLARPEDSADLVKPPCNALLAHLYTAAVCLQQLWKTRLGLLGRRFELPDRFSHGLGLPNPKTGYGESCFSEILDRLENGRAGARIRGADKMLAKLVHETFDLLAREALHAPAC